jgi:hypothetical protein
MSAPQVWLRSAIEAAAECDAYPVQAPADAAPPYVIYERTSTAREQILADTLDSPGAGTATPPTAGMTVLVYVDDYVQVWERADAIAAAIHGFAGEHEGTVIESALVVDAKDTSPEYIDGRDTPTYVVEMTVEVRWS